MRAAWALLLLPALLTGCVPGNLQEVVRALGEDPAANCVSVGTVYGTLAVARGTPNVSVNISGGACTITGVPVMQQQQFLQVPVRMAPYDLNVTPSK